MPIEPGDAFLIDLDGTNQSHLWVVLAVYTPELSSDSFAIIAHITTLKRTTQREHRVCILGPRDPDRYHFIHVESYVLYSHVAEIETERLARMPKNGTVGLGLLTRMRRGLHESRLTKRRFKHIVPRD